MTAFYRFLLEGELVDYCSQLILLMMAIDIDYQEDSLVDFDCKLDVIDKLEI